MTNDELRADIVISISILVYSVYKESHMVKEQNKRRHFVKSPLSGPREVIVT